eukprot:2893314-Pyramimonas_sp.AAC.1
MPPTRARSDDEWFKGTAHRLTAEGSFQVHPPSSPQSADGDSMAVDADMLSESGAQHTSEEAAEAFQVSMAAIIQKIEDVKTVASSKMVQLPDHKYMADFSKQLEEFVVERCLQVLFGEKSSPRHLWRPRRE